jgi:flagellar biosynthesis/type III secretory pathway chaperone
MSSSEQAPVDIDLKDGLRQAQALGTLLEREFEFLKAGNLDDFEQLQAQKADTIEQLSALVPLLTRASQTEEAKGEGEQDVRASEEASALLEQIEEALATCRDAHLRNAMLIDRKIESTRSALDVLRSSRSVETGETYDKLGKMRRGFSKGRQADV